MTQQLPLPGDFGAEPATALDLDALVERARIQAKATRSSEAAIAHVVHLLAANDGQMPLAGLLAAGVPRDVVAALVAEPTDKRARAKARLGVIGSDPWVWLTSSGHQASGRASGRERVPSQESAAHAISPSRVSDYFAARSERLAAFGVDVRVVSGAACRRLSEEVKARAWAALRSRPDAEGSIGLLTGGYIPDALVIVRTPNTEDGKALYRRCWGREPSDADLAESTCALEIESRDKREDRTRTKVQAAAEVVSLGATQAVAWIATSGEVARRLRDLGIDDAAREPTQWLAPGAAFGIEGEPIGPVTRAWWPLAVPADVT